MGVPPMEHIGKKKKGPSMNRTEPENPSAEPRPARFRNACAVAIAGAACAMLMALALAALANAQTPPSGIVPVVEESKSVGGGTSTDPDVNPDTCCCLPTISLSHTKVCKGCHFDGTFSVGTGNCPDDNAECDKEELHTANVVSVGGANVETQSVHSFTCPPGMTGGTFTLLAERCSPTQNVDHVYLSLCGKVKAYYTIYHMKAITNATPYVGCDFTKQKPNVQHIAPGGLIKLGADRCPVDAPVKWSVHKDPNNPGEHPNPELLNATGSSVTVRARQNDPVGSTFIVRAEFDVTGLLTCESSENHCVKEIKFVVVCPPADCQECDAGALVLDVCAASFNLGSTADGQSAGTFSLSTDTDSAPDANPAIFHGVFHSSVPVVYDNGVVRQILAPRIFADIVVLADTEFKIRVFDPDQIEEEPNSETGLYEPKNGQEPRIVYTVSNPDPDTLRIVRRIGESETVHDYTWEPLAEPPCRRLRQGAIENGQPVYKRSTTVHEEWDPELQAVVTAKIVSNPGSHIASQTRYYRGKFAPDSDEERLLKTVVGPPEAPISVVEYSYRTNAPAFGQIASVVHLDGAWERREYDASNRLALVVSGFKDAPPNAPANEAAATWYCYAAHTNQGDNPAIHPFSPRTVVQTILGVTNSILRRAYTNADDNVLAVIEERAASADLPFGHPDNPRTVTFRFHHPNLQLSDPDYAAKSWLHRRPDSIQHPDGRLDLYAYQFGSVSNNADGSYAFQEGPGDFRRTLVTRTIVGELDGIPGRTTRDISIMNSFGNLLQSETQVCEAPGQYATVRWTAHALDLFGRATQTRQSDGSISETEWGCCGPESRTGADGIVATYAYDALDRLEMTQKTVPGTNGVFTVHTLDPLGRPIATERQASALSLVTSNAYDQAGRLIWTRDPAGLLTEYLYDACCQSRTVVGPGAVTNKTVSFPDGRTRYTELNGVRQQTYDYGVHEDGSQWTLVYSGPEGTNSPAWQRTTTDMLGRTIRTERPGFESGTGVPPVISTTYEYNPKGQLIRTQSSTTGGVYAATLYQYNDLGQQILAAQDVNLNDAINLDGPDRVQGSDSFYEQDENLDWWHVSISTIYPHTNSVPFTNSVRKTRLTGLGVSDPELGLLSAETVSLDHLGNQTLSQTWTDREARARTSIVFAPHSDIPATNLTVNGLLVYSSDHAGIRHDYAYDPLERRTLVESLSDGGTRSVASVTEYNAQGQIAWTEDADANRTAYAYDPETGRQIAVTDPLTNTVHTRYSPEGHVLATWGATYPVAYEYDPLGRMIAMATTRNPAHANTNLWDILPAGIALSDVSDPSYPSDLDTTQWLYDHATGLLTNKLYSDNLGPAYAYTPDGMLETRTWARGIVTTYGYTPVTRELVSIEYSDETPSVAFDYDRLGRQISAAQSGGMGVPPMIHEYAYDPATLALASETIINHQSQITNVIARTQDPLGRPAAIALSSSSDPSDPSDPSYVSHYSYAPDGRLAEIGSAIQGLTNTWQYAYLPGSHLLSEICNLESQICAKRTYEPNRNLLASIETRACTGETCLALARFDYANDPLGRRTQRLDSGLNFPLAVTNDFGYNIRSEVVEALMGTNAYGYAYDPIGNRLAATNNAEALAYLSNPLNQYTNIGTGDIHVAPSYDPDGNMTAYADWTFAWNGENRLVAATNSASGLALAFAYDHQGRRFAKQVFNLESEIWNLKSQTLFAYDGWNLISEHTHSQTHALTNFFTWGPDLSGSMQGAGGIGGLLLVTKNDEQGTRNYAPAYDANGNITAYVDATGTNIVAAYEYDPFGNTIAASGSKADDFAFRFSTKYHDDETGLYYYGLRYYFPELGRWPSRDPIGERGGLNVYGFIRNASLFRMDILGLEEVKESVFWRSPFLYQRDLGIILWGQYHMLISVSYDNKTGIISKVEIDNEFWDFWLGISAGQRSALTWKAVREEPAISLNTASFSQTLFVGSDDFDELIHNIMIDVGFAAADVKIPGAGRFGNWIAKKVFKKGVKTAVHALGKHDKPNTYVSTDFLFRTTCPDGETKYRLVKPYQASNQLHKTRKMWFQERIMQEHHDMVLRDEFHVKDALKDAGWSDERIQSYLDEMEKWNMYVQ